MEERNAPQESITASQQNFEEVKKEYTYYNKKLISDAYASGDIYDEKTTGDKRQIWEIK